MKKQLLPLIFIASSFAAYSEESSLKDIKLINQINTYKIKRGGLTQLTEDKVKHKFGVKWNTRGSCGDFDMDYNIQNTLDKKDLQRMMDSWIMKAKSALDPASLIALAFQRANPDLYEKIQNGILQAKTEFADDVGMCESIQNEILNHAPDGALEKLTVKQEYQEQVSNAFENNQTVDIGDMTDFIHDVGDKGILIMGERFGGKDQPSIESTKLTTRAGMNALAGRENEPNSTAPYGFTEEEAEKYGITQYFPTVDSAEKFITQMVGETKYNTAEGTNVIDNVKPLGINYQIFVLQEELELEINEIITLIKNSAPAIEINEIINEFNKKIIPSSITRVMFNELISMEFMEAQGYIDSLSKEFASQIVVERTLVARRILYTGMLEASIQGTEFIPEDISRKLELMDWEMNNLEREQRFRRYYNRDTSMTLLERAMRNKMSEGVLIESNKGVFQ